MALKDDDFESWLFDARHRELPDFLDLPEVSPIPNGLQKNDIHALAVLSRARGTRLPTWTYSALVRLHHHGIIGRETTPDGARYYMTDHAVSVLRHNASFRLRAHYE